MIVDWFEYVADHLTELNLSTAPLSRALVAMFVLEAEFDNGGLSQYLMNDSGNTWLDLRMAFESNGFEAGLQWMGEVERIYGGTLPVDRDTRLDRIPALAGWVDGEDPFESPGKELRDSLMPRIHQIAEKLVLSHRALEGHHGKSGTGKSGKSGTDNE